MKNLGADYRCPLMDTNGEFETPSINLIEGGKIEAEYLITPPFTLTLENYVGKKTTNICDLIAP